MDCLDWNWFAGWDDETLIPINLTAREMALLLTALSYVDDVDQWCDEDDFYIDAVFLIETITTLIADDGIVP